MRLIKINNSHPMLNHYLKYLLSKEFQTAVYLVRGLDMNRSNEKSSGTLRIEVSRICGQNGKRIRDRTRGHL